MEARTYKPYFVVIGLMALTSLALAFTVNVRITDEAGIKMFLPDEIGEWRGSEVRFCQNRMCRKDYLVRDLEDPDVCPACGEALDGMSVEEHELLPKDTVLLKKRYDHPSGQVVLVSIVLSGKERASIHRPQVCLRGQANEIVRDYTISVPLDGREPLKVMVLDLLEKRRGRDGRREEATRYYAYWFVGKGRETHRHTMRMLYMATDRIFRNVAHRWAYISVAGSREEGSSAHEEEIREFLRDLYPEMLLEG